MANKERNKRSARQARARERAAQEARAAAMAPASATRAAKAAPAKSASPEKRNKELTRAEKVGFLGRIRNYLRDVRTEMHRVVWPSRRELTNYSVAVIAMLIVFGVLVWAVDTGFVALLVAFTGLRG